VAGPGTYWRESSPSPTESDAGVAAAGGGGGEGGAAAAASEAAAPSVPQCLAPAL